MFYAESLFGLQGKYQDDYPRLGILASKIFGGSGGYSSLKKKEFDEKNLPDGGVSGASGSANGGLW